MNPQDGSFVSVSFMEAIGKVAQEFSMSTVTALVERVKKEKLLTTKQLMNSIDEETKTDLSRLVTAIDFAFEDYGRYQDMKRRRREQQPPVDKIIDWVIDKGLTSFGADPNPNKKKPKTSLRRANEIAWGIAKNMQKRPRKDKGRAWFQKTFYRNLNALREEIALGIEERSVDQLRASLLYRLQQGAITNYLQ